MKSNLLKKEHKRTTKQESRTPTNWKANLMLKTRQGLKRLRPLITGQDKKTMPEKLKLPILTILLTPKMMLAELKLQQLTSSQKLKMREESLKLQLLTNGVMQNKLPEMLRIRLSLRGLKRKSVTGRTQCLNCNQEWIHKTMTRQEK